MDKVTAKKRQILQQITQYIIAHGFADIGVRKLASVAGTSDRMLIYYFETKDGLIGQVLNAISSNFTQQLDALLGHHQRTPDVLMQELLTLAQSPEFEPIICLWFELVGLAARGQEPYATNATAIANNWLQWIVGRLEDEYVDQATALFAELEGRLMLSVVGVEL